MVTAIPGFPADVLAQSYHGRLTRADFETVIIPAIESALQASPTLRFYCDAVEFTNLAPHAKTGSSRRILPDDPDGARSPDSYDARRAASGR